MAGSDDDERSAPGPAALDGSASLEQAADGTFIPPPGQPQPLELDPAWLAERARPAPKRPSHAAATVVAVLLVALVGIGVYALYSHREEVRPGAGVSIRVTSVVPTHVAIDGKPAGKTPLVISRPKGTTPILITAPSLNKVRQVVPDRDQTVNLSAP